MFMRILQTAWLLLILAFAASLSAFTGADDITGTWFNQDKDAKIEIAKCGDNYCAKIVWLKEPTYPAGSKLGAPGTPKLDDKNPDAARRKDPLMGLEIIKGFQFAGGNVWKNGTIYDPDSGKTYSAKATLVSANELDLRGFIGVSMFGRTEKWTRAN
jgi:uncharacterized protein (DUF2147 family)